MNNPVADKYIYTFTNVVTGEKFSGTRYDFYIKYNFSRVGIHRLVKLQTKQYKNWRLEEL